MVDVFIGPCFPIEDSRLNTKVRLQRIKFRLPIEKMTEQSDYHKCSFFNRQLTASGGSGFSLKRLRVHIRYMTLPAITP